MLTIYHNPRCSKSREALALVQQFGERHGQPPQVVEYLKTPPTLEQLRELQRQLGVPAQAMVRSNEAEYDSLQLAHADDETLLRAVAGCPKLLQRPIVVQRGRALIARPPELLDDWLQQG
ncbi:MAG: arsenate reductase (glutaredoxin) [Burkholderiaceae bacterium]